MKIGLVVDGYSEFYGLPHLLPRLIGPHDILEPIRADIQPLAPVSQIARAAARRCQILVQKAVDHVVILLDQESRPGCPGQLAADIARQVRNALGAKGPEVSVVLKVRALENWLVADPQAITRNPGSFAPPARFRRHVVPDRADAVDAFALLRQWAKPKGTYHKVKGAVAILRHLEPRGAGQNSRSLRRFLRVVGDPVYASQSRLPAP